MAEHAGHVLAPGHVLVPLGCEADSEFADSELLGQGAYGMVHRVQDKAGLTGHFEAPFCQVTGQSKVLKSVVRPEGWDDERLKLEVRKSS